MTDTSATLQPKHDVGLVQARIRELVKDWPNEARLMFVVFIAIAVMSGLAALESYGVIDLDWLWKAIGVTEKVIGLVGLAALGTGGAAYAGYTAFNDRPKKKAEEIVREVETLAPVQPDIDAIVQRAMKDINALVDGNAVIDKDMLDRVQKLIADGELLRNSLAQKDIALEQEKKKSISYYNALAALLQAIGNLPDLARISEALKNATEAQASLKEIAAVSVAAISPSPVLSAGAES